MPSLPPLRIGSTSQVLGVRIPTVKPGVKAIPRFHSALAFALTLWCAGAGCMIVSYAHGASLSGADPSGAASEKPWNDVAATMGNHSCCKARHSSSKRNGHATANHRTESFNGFQQVTIPDSPSRSGANNCCPLTSGSFVTTSRAQSNDDNVSPTDQDNSFSLVLTNSLTAPRAFPLRLRDQNQTYLRGCVFLI